MATEVSLAYELQVVSRRARGYSGLSDSKADDTLLSVGTLHLPLTHAFLLPLNHYSLRIYHEQGGGAGWVAKMCPTLATPWTVARQPPPSMGFSRQEYWSGLPFPSNKPKIQIQSSAGRITTSLRGKTNKQKLSTNLPIRSLHKPLDQPQEGRKQKEEFSPEAWEKETSNTIS